MNMDASLLLKRATDVVFLKNPIGTAMGILGGVVAHGLAIGVWAFERLNILYYMVAGIFGFNIYPFLKNTNTNLEPKIEQAFNVIDEAVKRGEFSTVHSRAMYKHAVNEYLEEKFSGEVKSKTVKKVISDSELKTTINEHRGN